VRRMGALLKQLDGKGNNQHSAEGMVVGRFQHQRSYGHRGGTAAHEQCSPAPRIGLRVGLASCSLLRLQPDLDQAADGYLTFRMS
jgi:hypothetical protein